MTRKECPRCHHELFDRDVVLYCIVCKYEEKKPLVVLGKEYDAFDFQSLGDAIEDVYEKLMHFIKHNQGVDPLKLVTMLREVDRLRALQLNLAMNKAEVATAFLKNYGSTMEAMKQILEEKGATGDDR